MILDLSKETYMSQGSKKFALNASDGKKILKGMGFGSCRLCGGLPDC